MTVVISSFGIFKIPHRGLARGSLSKVYFKKAILKSLAKFAGRHLHWELFPKRDVYYRPAELLKRVSVLGVYLLILQNNWNILAQIF